MFITEKVKAAKSCLEAVQSRVLKNTWDSRSLICFVVVSDGSFSRMKFSHLNGSNQLKRKTIFYENFNNYQRVVDLNMYKNLKPMLSNRKKPEGHLSTLNVSDDSPQKMIRFSLTVKWYHSLYWKSINCFNGTRIVRLMI